MRIASFLPGATEIACRLGLSRSLVAVSHECDFPENVRDLPRITRARIDTAASGGAINASVQQAVADDLSLYTLDTDVLLRTKPELLITQSLCGVCAVSMPEVAAAAEALPSKPEIVSLSPQRLEDIFTNMHTIARVCNRPESATAVEAELRERISDVQQTLSRVAPAKPRVVVLEWLDPLYNAGHWTPELVALAGGNEVAGKAGERSQPISWPELLALNPDILVIACCGFSLERALSEAAVLSRRPEWRRLACVQKNRVFLTDGSAYFNRPGPRLVDSLEILAHAFYPALFSLPAATKPVLVRFDREMQEAPPDSPAAHT